MPIVLSRVDGQGLVHLAKGKGIHEWITNPLFRISGGPERSTKSNHLQHSRGDRFNHTWCIQGSTRWEEGWSARNCDELQRCHHGDNSETPSETWNREDTHQPPDHVNSCGWVEDDAPVLRIRIRENIGSGLFIHKKTPCYSNFLVIK